MAAIVEYDFPNYFEMDEEKIRRIHSILKKRIPDENHSDILFIVKKSDNFIFHTKNINDVINDNNDSTSKITSIEINYRSTSVDINVSLTKIYGASINISGADRDEVFLLSSELKEYISKEVANIRRFRWLKSSTILSLFMLIFLSYILYVFSTFKTVDSDALNTVLESTNTNDKLNFLIQKNKELPSSTTMLTPMFSLLCLMLLSQIIPFEKIINYLYPRNIFLFGKEIAIIEKKKRNRSNLFWVVGVGGVISLVVAYISVKYM
ncbi:hypothetical protein PF050_13975 [Kosakonia pseudosacchari]|uniref:hypothetical protein n=1 Tax=Kosakonia pseudosacchari TaxID=1646340 RepID=UPI0022F0B9A9|nr:hypothetical protein [Kosakonia pseudosacchari]WBU47603.1 hypothetical protein PF050_13975 [Kosakonia pseudosacchari]